MGAIRKLKKYFFGKNEELNENELIGLISTYLTINYKALDAFLVNHNAQVTSREVWEFFTKQNASMALMLIKEAFLIDSTSAYLMIGSALEATRREVKKDGQIR
jgi:hypothetical protein